MLSCNQEKLKSNNFILSLLRETTNRNIKKCKEEVNMNKLVEIDNPNNPNDVYFVIPLISFFSFLLGYHFCKYKYYY
jgi:hypothetical protein